MKKNYTRKQIQEAISYWQNELQMMNETEKSEKYHSLKSYTRLEDKETANCALMCKPSSDRKTMIFRWVPYDEIYDLRFDDDWILSPEIDDNEPNFSHEDIKKSIDRIYIGK